MWIAVVVAASVLSMLLIAAAMRSPDFHIVREARIAAPPDVIFPHLNAMRAFDAWNPWGKLDPKMKKTFEGPESGVGAAMRWEGNAQVGAGRAEIVESLPERRVRVRLDYTRPFRSTSHGELELRPEGSETVVSWSITGCYAFLPKVIGLIVNMDKMIGQTFERGLADLRTAAETDAAQR